MAEVNFDLGCHFFYLSSVKQSVFIGNYKLLSIEGLIYYLKYFSLAVSNRQLSAIKEFSFLYNLFTTITLCLIKIARCLKCLQIKYIFVEFDSVSTL